MKSKGITNIIGIFVSVIAGVISLYTQSQDPQTGLILYLALVGAIIIYFIISYVVDIIKEKVEQLNKNTESSEILRKDLNTLKEKLDLKNELDNLKIRMLNLEGLFKIKGKKGAIDPRMIIIIVIIILLYLYLKSKGFFQ